MDLAGAPTSRRRISRRNIALLPMTDERVQEGEPASARHGEEVV
jgi:hypothetical protein